MKTLKRILKIKYGVREDFIWVNGDNGDVYFEYCHVLTKAIKRWCEVVAGSDRIFLLRLDSNKIEDFIMEQVFVSGEISDEKDWKEKCKEAEKKLDVKEFKKIIYE